MLSRDRIREGSVPGKISKQGRVYSLEDVTVKFNSVYALKSVNLIIHENEMVFITGPSGAGKTTLLRVLAGLQRPNSGTISGPDAFHRKDLFYPSLVFQDLKLIEDWTCEENLFVAYDPKVYSAKDEFYKDMMEYTKFFGVQSRMQLKVKKANGGLKQKIAIIRSLLTRPKVLLADEPTSALDRDNSIKLYEILYYLNEKYGLTVIWASHNKELIKQLNGRIIHLDSGKLIYTGHSCFI